MGAREIAYSVLVEYKQSGTDVSVLLDRAINDEKPGALDRSLATELVYGCMGILLFDTFSQILAAEQVDRLL